MKDLLEVPTWRREVESVQRPSAPKAPNTTTQPTTPRDCKSGAEKMNEKMNEYFTYGIAMKIRLDCLYSQIKLSLKRKAGSLCIGTD